MGQIADIVTSPEFAQKTPLEKAQSRRDLFALTLKQNPQIEQQFNAADEAGQQAMANEFKSKLETTFPNAFKSDGYKVTVGEDGGLQYDAGKVEHLGWFGNQTSTVARHRKPVNDIATEQVLERFKPLDLRIKELEAHGVKYQGTPEGKALFDSYKQDEALAASLSDEETDKIARFSLERYGFDSMVKPRNPETIYKRDESTAKKVFNVAVPMVTRVAPAIVAGIATKDPSKVFMAGAGGEAAAQVEEKILGTRQEYSPTEIGLNGLFSIIPGATLGKLANPALNMTAQAGIHGLMGATQAGMYETSRQLLEGEKLDAGKVGSAAMWGGGIGALLGGLPPAYAAMFSGKSREEVQAVLPKLIATASEADKPALTALQKQIEDSLNVGAEVKPAGESAVALSAEHPPVVNSARDSADVLTGEPYKSPRQLDVESALNEADANAQSPQGAKNLAANIKAEATASQLENRTGRAAITPDSTIPILEKGEAPRDPRLVDGPAPDPLGTHNMPAPEMNVGQMGKVRPASDFNLPDADPVTSARGSAIAALREGSAVGVAPEVKAAAPESAAVTPQTPGSKLPSEPVTGQGSVATLPAISVRSQAGAVLPTTMDIANAKIKGNQGGFVSPQLATSIASGAAGFIAGNQIGDTPEDRLRNGLVLGVAGLGGGYAFGKRFLATSLANPSNLHPGLKSLADVEQILTPPAKPGLIDKANALPSKLMTAFVTKYHALGALEATVNKANGIVAPALNLTRKFEQVAGASGQAVGDVHRFADEVLPAIKGNEKDFDQLLTVKRIGQRLQEVQDLQQKQSAIAAIPANQRTAADVEIMAQDATRKRVADWTLPDVDNVLSQLETKIGTKRFNELDQVAAGSFQAHLDQTLKMQVTAGRLSQESYDAIKAGNDFYAPFRVLQTIEGIETHGSAGIDTKQQIAKAITGIDDQGFRLDSPLKAAAEQIFAGRVLAEKNMKMLELAAVADSDKAGDFIKKIQAGQEPRKGFETVNYFENGQAGRMEVSPDVASAVKGMNTAQTSLVMKTLSKGAVPFRAGATWANASFQAVNLIFADQPRLALVSKYGLNANDILDPNFGPARYAADFVHSLYSSIGANMAGKQTQLYREFMASGSAGATIQEALTPSVFNKSNILGDAIRPVSKVVDTVAEFAKAIEETTKIMGFKRGMRLEGIEELIKTDPKAAQAKLEEVVTEVRNYTGSPDFARHGNAVAGLNIIFPFFNARIQGNVSDLSRMAGADGAKAAAGVYLRVGAVVGVPAAGLWYLNQRDDNKADYAQVPSIERQNYFMLPQYDADGKPKYFTNSDGKPVREYLRVPKRETVRLFAGLVESSLDFAASKDPESLRQYGISFLENVTPVNVDGKSFGERLQSVLASTNPLIKAPLELASGKNFYTHRDTIPARLQGTGPLGTSPGEQYTPNTPELFVKAAHAMPDFAPEALRSPLVLQQLTSTLSAGLVTQFNKGAPLDGRSSLSTNIVAGRFFRSQTLNRDQEIADVGTPLREQDDARVRLDREAQASLTALHQAPQDRRLAMFDQMAAEKPELVQKMADIASKQAKGLEYDESLIGRLGVENGARAQFLLKQIRTLPQEKRVVYFDDMVEKGLLNDAVADQMMGITKDEARGIDNHLISLISQMDVADGSRAKYLLQKIQSLPQDKKTEFFDAMVEKGLLNDTIAEQIAQAVQPASAP